MNELMCLSFENMPVRAIEKNGEIWWILTDVCNILELSTPAKVAQRLDDDEKGVNLIHTLKGNQSAIVINESGLYSVILRSRKPEAKAFKRWITHKVLPQIRKTGGYSSVNINKIMSDPTLTAAAKLIFMYLHNKANGSDEIVISKSQILFDLNMGNDQYINHLKKLKSSGYLSSEIYRGADGKVHGTKFNLNYNQLALLENTDSGRKIK